MKHLSLFAALFLTVLPVLDAVPVVLQSNPAGATVRILNVEATAQKGKPAQRATPAKAEIQKNKSGEPYTLEFSKDGFETVRIPLDLRAKLTGPVSVELPPLAWSREVSLTSYPSGAYVSVAGSAAGQTPLKVRLQFTRPDSRSPWSTTELRFALPDHQTETATMTQDPGRTALEIELARLKDDVSVEVVANTTDGGAIERAHILVDGARKGDTPARVIMPFHRAKKTDPWNEVRMAVEIPDEYQRVERTFTYPAPAKARFELPPVTEMTVTRYFPAVRMTPRGPRIEIDQSQSIGTVDDRDEGTTSVRTDGTAYTNLGEVGQMPNFSENGRIYFSRLAEDTRKYQLYSILADGTGIETVLTDYSFASFNCHPLSISSDGRRLLFVKDYNSEKGARTDSNIWMIDLTGSRQPFQLTTNRSEDLAPRWSPTEPDVIHFLSNRRGVFNVWQMAFKTVR